VVLSMKTFIGVHSDDRYGVIGADGQMTLVERAPIRGAEFGLCHVDEETIAVVVGNPPNNLDTRGLGTNSVVVMNAPPVADGDRVSLRATASGRSAEASMAAALAVTVVGFGLATVIPRNFLVAIDDFTATVQLAFDDEKDAWNVTVWE